MNENTKGSIKKRLLLLVYAFLMLFSITMTGAFSLPKEKPLLLSPTINETQAAVEETFLQEPQKTVFEESEEKESSDESDSAVSPAETPDNLSKTLPVRALDAKTNDTVEKIFFGFDSVTVYDTVAEKNTNMPFEEYVLGVLLSEMPTSFEPEALKAQAIACRTYTVYKQSMGTSHKSGAQLCTSPSHCQAFTDPWSVSTERYEKAYAAVNATRGQIMLFDGKPVLAVFHASSDSKTRSSEEVWGGKLSYLVSVDTAEAFNPTMNITKEYCFSKSDFSEKLGMSVSCISDIRLEKSASGSVSRVVIGEKSINGGDFVRLFGLRSHSFDLSVTDDKVTIICGGYGHGVGMSQYGAQDMAQKGYDCYEILSHYYTGISFGNVR